MITTLWYPMAQAVLRQQGYEDCGDGKQFRHKRSGKKIDLKNYQDMTEFMKDIKVSIAESIIDLVLASKSL